MATPPFHVEYYCPQSNFWRWDGKESENITSVMFEAILLTITRNVRVVDYSDRIIWESTTYVQSNAAKTK